MSLPDRASFPPRRIFDWPCVERSLRLGERTLIMGILNVTPDSFSDGGRYEQRASAVTRALQMVEDGVDIIDVGGESTRPGAQAVEASEELHRVVPVIKELCQQVDVPISIDTTKTEVAAAAIEAGACIINDVSAGGEPGMADLAAKTGAGFVLMHMQGTPRTMQVEPVYEAVTREVVAFLSARMTAVMEHDVDQSRICVDPGIGFGKTLEHNLELLACLPELQALGVPLLVGLSRKGMLGEITGRAVEDRLSASLAGLVYAITRGAHILRVHDVKESCDAARVADILTSVEHHCE
ncbi:MAG: dihydropteroate synthase [Kiritimatiellia bacterium]|jgi:dihydropteroate synthase